jgi:hypothetical protein
MPLLTFCSLRLSDIFEMIYHVRVHVTAIFLYNGAEWKKMSLVVTELWGQRSACICNEARYHVVVIIRKCLT